MTFNDTDLTRDRTMDSNDKHEPPPSTTLVQADGPFAVTFVQPLDEKYHCTFTQNDPGGKAHHLKPPVKQLACGHRLVSGDGNYPDFHTQELDCFFVVRCVNSEHACVCFKTRSCANNCNDRIR